jgi:hypothetical protein
LICFALETAQFERRACIRDLPLCSWKSLETFRSAASRILEGIHGDCAA